MGASLIHATSQSHITHHTSHVAFELPEQSSGNEQRALLYAVGVRLGPLKQRHELGADGANRVSDAGGRAAALQVGGRWCRRH